MSRLRVGSCTPFRRTWKNGNMANVHCLSSLEFSSFQPVCSEISRCKLKRQIGLFQSESRDTSEEGGDRWSSWRRSGMVWASPDKSRFLARWLERASWPFARTGSITATRWRCSEFRSVERAHGERGICRQAGAFVAGFKAVAGFHLQCAYGGRGRPTYFLIMMGGSSHSPAIANREERFQNEE